MPLYSNEFLATTWANHPNHLRQQILNESKRTHDQFDVFLSHSFLDRDVVGGLYVLLTRQGLSVYVDWIIDPDLDRTKVTKATAEKVRMRMKMCDSLLYAISSNASVSRWMPWELGYLDGRKERCALVPVSTEGRLEQIYHRAEYLQLYPYVKPETLGTGGSSLFVLEEGRRYAKLADWLRGRSEITNQYHDLDMI